MSLSMAPSAPLEDVEWRVDGKPYENRSRFVAYVSAATVARLMDQWLGPENWSDDYERDEGSKGMWCTIRVNADDDEWIPKRDIGVPSNFEAEKGTVSDAFKRCACIKWGVARNVWSLPQLWAPCKVYTDRKGNEQAQPNDKTLPSIRKQLQQMGYEATGIKVGASQSDSDLAGSEQSEPTAAPEPPLRSAPQAAAAPPSSETESGVPPNLAPQAADPAPSHQSSEGGGAQKGVWGSASDEDASPPGARLVANYYNAGDSKRRNTVLRMATTLSTQQDVMPPEGVNAHNIDKWDPQVLAEIVERHRLNDQGSLV